MNKIETAHYAPPFLARPPFRLIHNFMYSFLAGEDAFSDG